jgi:hypothetical protein
MGVHGMGTVDAIFDRLCDAIEAKLA